MNPFKSRKKSHDGGESSQRTSSDDTPALPTPRSRTFRRKKPQPEPKLELDLSTALPSTENFRTSLLMPNLSARFSMLRDQDDPTTKIGKANDDSVLFPKRMSRLGLFTQGLSDIAEVSSLPHPVRPPFAYGERTNSYASTDGYGTDDDSQSGSVMSRSKPGQGNRFFGGRQKIYKIPVGGSTSAKELSTTGNAPHKMGRAVYDDDVAVSAFQALKQREKEEHNGSDTHVQDHNLDHISGDSRGSPTLSGYNRNRETSSSTTSGPFNARASTAATSVASQNTSSLYGAPQSTATSPNNTSSTKQQPGTTVGPDRGTTKSKRMYGQGLDQQMYEQQSSAMNRLDSIQRRRGLLSNGVSQSRSATNLNDRFQRQAPLYTCTNFRPNSPPPSASATGLSGFDLGLDAERPVMVGRDSDPAYGRSPSLSPPLSPNLGPSPLVASVDPNDIGKATATGAFDKPRLQYSEEQYAQRQLKLQEGRETPPLRGPSRTDAYSEMSGRLRNDSFASIDSIQASKPFHYGQSASQPVLSALSEIGKAKGRPAAFDPYQNSNGTFLAGFSGDESSQVDSEGERDSIDLPTLQPTKYQSMHKAAEEPSVPSIYEHDDQHPAFLHGKEDDTAELALATHEQSSSVEQQDSGTGIVSGLSGLIRTHLRNQSGQSSVYPDSPPPELEDPPDLPKSHLFEDYNRASGTSDVDEHNKLSVKGDSPGSPPQAGGETFAQAPLSLRARQILDQATQLKNRSPTAQGMPGMHGIDKVQQILGKEVPHGSQESMKSSWQEQLKSHHTRGGSTETEREREDFANELADRRKRVQENLQSFVESGSRSSSPMGRAQGRENSLNGAPGVLSLLKKANGGSMVARSDTAASSKAMKMLGMTSDSKGTSPYMGQDAAQKDLYQREINGTSKGPMQSSTAKPFLKAGTGDGLSFKERSIGAERRSKFQNRKGALLRRDQPDSTVSAEPSPKVNGSFNTSHMDNAIAEQINGVNGNIPASRKYSPPRRFDPAADYVAQPRSQSAMSNRSRSNSRSKTAGYFDHKAQLSIQPSYQNSYPAPVGRPPRASPVAPYPPHTASPLSDITSTAPIMVTDGAAPPTTRAFAARKRSVNKQDISEPTFINCTSSVTTVDLPPGASLSNGMDSPVGPKPPVPPINPRRRRAPVTQNVFTAFGGKSARNEQSDHPSHHVQSPTDTLELHRTVTEPPYEERSGFSADENEPKQKRNRLRKTSSEGGNMAAKARQQALMAESPAMPSTPAPGGPAGGGKGGRLVGVGVAG